MARSPFGVTASEPRLAEAANGALERGGSAVDACIASFLMGAALWPGVTLGAAVVLTAGPGIGARYFDGALVQPGRGAPRPRGFRPEDPIVEAARVGVSSAVVALYAAHAHDGVLPLSELASPAVRVATSAALRSRATLLKRIGASGPLATRETGFVRAVLDVASRANGGCVTERDLADVSADVSAPEMVGRLMRVPSTDRPQVPVVLDTFIVCACDSRGSIACMHVSYDADGPDVAAYEVKAPRTAILVRRGVPRVTPGARLGMSPPIAILTDEHDVPWCGVAFEAGSDLALEGLSIDRDDGITIEQALRASIERGSSDARGACAVIRSTVPGGQVRALHLKSGAQS